MSEYSRDYCPGCDKRTDHEDDVCMECGRLPFEDVNNSDAALPLADAGAVPWI